MPTANKNSSKQEKINAEAARNYWKLLCEFKLYDSDGNGLPQNPVKPTFDMKAANRLLKKYDGSHKEFPVADNVVDAFLRYKETGETSINMEDGQTASLNGIQIR